MREIRKCRLSVLAGLIVIFSAVCFAAETRTNVIIEENKKEGSAEWLLTMVENRTCPKPDHHWCRRKEIEGYCSHTSIRAGQTLSVFVSTDPVTRYNVDIYRLGYYGGKGGCLKMSLGPFEGIIQSTPEDGENNLRECKWKESFKIGIPKEWISGVYLGKLATVDSQYESYIIFIVRDDRKADLLFQCSDITWQAYNRWPAWRSLYDSNDNPWYTRPTPWPLVGFDRPYVIYYNGLPANFTPLSNGSGEFLLWEFPLAFWMEKEGYDVTYISNIDTHSDPNGLLRAKGFLSVGHDEYWTEEMFENVMSAREAGVNIAFLSGNSISGRIHLEKNSNGVPNRVFGRVEDFKDEKDLMGSTSYGVGLGDWICAEPNHWIFEGTGMKKGDKINDLVGWEYHGPPLAGYPDLTVVAEGPLKNGGGTPIGGTYAATVYICPKGNFVFNAATCWWSMVLSSPPGFVNPPKKDFSKDDPRVQRMTKNILDRMIKKASD